MMLGLDPTYKSMGVMVKVIASAAPHPSPLPARGEGEHPAPCPDMRVKKNSKKSDDQLGRGGFGTGI